VPAEALRKDGATVVFLAVDGKLAGLLAVADPIKESSHGAIKQLHQLGLKIIMLTGDNERTARRVAAQLGIDEVEAGDGQCEERVVLVLHRDDAVVVGGKSLRFHQGLAAAV